MEHILKHQKISIIGCGWLGFSLAKHLIKSGAKIKGSTTSKSKIDVLKNEGIKPFLIQLTEKTISDSIIAFLAQSETLIINIPPGLRRNPEKNHVSEIKILIKAIEKSNIKNVLYISSISVYKNDFPFPTITNNDKANASTNNGKQLIEIEKLLKNNLNFKTTILRFSGLIDSERHPSKMLAGRKAILNADAPVNLIHKDDCIGIITKIIENNIWDVTLNAAFPFHPTKKEYYSEYCKTHNLIIPQFSTSSSKGKIIDGSELAQLLNYEYKNCP